MPFENFYKEADRYAHRWRWCLIAAIFFIAAYFAVPFFLVWLFSPPPPPLTSNSINEIAARYADALCVNLPKPERLSLSSASSPQHTNDSVTVVYTYYSERNYEEVLPAFMIWFSENGWERVFDEVYARRNASGSTFNFRKGDQRVSVSYFDLRNAAPSQIRYEIACKVEKERMVKSMTN